MRWDRKVQTADCWLITAMCPDRTTSIVGELHMLPCITEGRSISFILTAPYCSRYTRLSSARSCWPRPWRSPSRLRYWIFEYCSCPWIVDRTCLLWARRMYLHTFPAGRGTLRIWQFWFGARGLVLARHQICFNPGLKLTKLGLTCWSTRWPAAIRPIATSCFRV